MSAYIVSDDHLDLLITAAMHGGRWDKGLRVNGRTFESREDANDLGAILAAENRRSVNYRYQEDDLETIYQWRPDGIARYLGGVLTWGDVLGALRCYEYQACEAPDWESTDAYQVCEALRRKVCGIISGDAWSWDRSDLAAKLEEMRKKSPKVGE